MEHVEAGRILMGDSLGFHIIFALLGVGLPVCFSLMEFLAIRRSDKALREHARLWSSVASVLVITGVISGIVVALQMFLIWPGILDFGGSAIGLGFSLEGYAFLFEAIFLAYYMKTWDKLKGYAHWALSIPVVLGATLSAYLITAVDAWMNHPSGFDYVNGQVVNPRPAEAIFNQTAVVQGTHSIVSYYMTAALIVAAAYAWMTWRGGRPVAGTASTTRSIMRTFTLLAAGLLVIVAVLGDVSSKYLAKHEPTKLAALELLHGTQSNAPLYAGGNLDSNQTVTGGIEIPGALSFLTGWSTDTVVKGLDQQPQHVWPPLVIHTLFGVKMLLVVILAGVALAAAWVLRKRSITVRKLPRGVLAGLIAAPIISITVLELGWMMTELGRQPYAVYGYVLTKDAMTDNAGVYQLGWIFPAAFLLLLLATIVSLRILLKRYTPLLGRRAS